MLFSPLIDAVLAGLAGLLLGSFLNVVIYRLPKMMERQWAAECAELSGKEPEAEGTPFNLVVPRSRCQQCGHQISWYENIPVISWVVLRGKCSSCKTPISPRYPLVELLTGALFFLCIWTNGWSLTGLAWCGFSAAIVALAFIDWDTTLLPDDITLPLLWAGLLAATLKWTAVPLPVALWGAVGGYLSLWLVYWAFKLLTGREGMGYGDFKLFAALGAWFGWTALVPIILMASVIGAVVGIALKFSSGLREGGYVPFGPFLAGAGLTAMIFGPQSILRVVGSDAMRMPVRLGLTGGIGSGKSTVATMLAALGAAIIDADANARAVTAAGGSAIAAIAAEFGASFIGADGAMDRDAMRALAYADAGAKQRLEAIIHPLVGQAGARQAQAAMAAGHACIVFDIPLLVESGRWRQQLDRILVVDCTAPTQISRVVARSALSPDAVERIIAAQASRARRLAAADAVIFNDGLTLDGLQAEVRQAAQGFGLSLR